MKIVTWNCNGALRDKFEILCELQADIYIIQECEDPAAIRHQKYAEWANNHLWIGDTKNKGLGIFAGDHIKLERINWTCAFEDHSVKHFLPCKINNDIQLLGVWTHHNNSPSFGYIGQFWKYLQVNKKYFSNIIIAGDFNSNIQWDQRKRWWNHSDVVRELSGMGIHSFYHLHNNVNQGNETHPTFYLYRKLHRPYHIDYIFGSQAICDKLASVDIGDCDQWLKFSDHLPMTCNLNKGNYKK